MLHALIQIYVQAFLPLSIGVLWAATRWGGRTEKVVAWSFVLATVTQKLSEGLFAKAFTQIEPSVAIVDTLLVCVLWWASIRDPRWWLLTASALQLLSVMAHFARLADLTMSPLAYAILMGTGGYPTQLLLIAGIVGFHFREGRRNAGSRLLTGDRPIR